MILFKSFLAEMGDLENRVTGLMSSFRFFWLLPVSKIHPSGAIVPVKFANHDLYIKQHPEEFNMKPEDVKEGVYFVYRSALAHNAARIGLKNELCEVQTLNRETLRVVAPAVYKFCKENPQVAYINVDTLEGDFRKLINLERFRLLF